MLLLGLDEVGRGCWAGPLVAGAVLLDSNFNVPDGEGWLLGDSKKLTKLQRDRADVGVRDAALSYGLGWVSSVEVDELGLTAAVSLAMRRAVKAVGEDVDEIIIDGSFNFLPDLANARAVIKADGSIPAVSAASIIAKVARDNWMAEEAAKLHPGYGFEKHVGYGTRQHIEALRRLGPCDLHRRSYKPVRQYVLD